MIVRLDVYSETIDKRREVGVLSRTDEGYEFYYCDSWLEYKGSIPLGPDLRLTPRTYKQPALFESFLARIPPRNSENYARYCKERHIDVSESDPLKLLGTIGHKAASSFVFEISNSEERLNRIVLILQQLTNKFSLRIVASSLNLSHSVLQNFQKRHAPNSLVFNYIEATFQSEESLAYRLRLNHTLPDNTKVAIKSEFRQFIDSKEPS